MKIRNLLRETEQELKDNGKTEADVRWVGLRVLAYEDDSEAGLPRGTWADFAALADFDYNSDYGGAEVNQRLIVVGDDWWLERGEYDGAEWWEFKTLPVRGERGVALSEDDLRG